MAVERMSQDEKISRARVLRDAALTILRRAGAWQTAEPVKVLQAHVGTIAIGYRTPVQSVPESNDMVLRSYGTLIGRSVWRNRLPFGLDISVPANTPEKVLCVEWDEDGAVFLDSFWPGAWEAEIMAAAERGAS